MSKTIASEDVVFAAADNLHALGVEPTYKNIIEALGGGSNSTIKPFLDAWLQKVRPTVVATPETIETRSKVFVNALWAEAVAQARHEIDRNRVQADTNIARARTALASSIELNVQLEIQRNESLLQIERDHQKIADLRAELRRTDDIKSELSNALICVEQTRQIADARALDAIRLEGENTVLKDQLRQVLDRLSSRNTNRQVKTLPGAQSPL